MLARLYAANANYREALRQFKTRQLLSTLDDRIAVQLRTRDKAAGLGELDLIQAELSTLQADLRRDLSYADLRNAYGQTFAKAGLEPLPERLESTQSQAIAAALTTREANGADGSLTAQ